MSSVAQDMVQCEHCREYGSQSEMRVKGLRLDGSTRYKHRVGYGCMARPQSAEETTALDVRSQAFDQAFYDPAKGYNLTALWRAKGCPSSREVRRWLATDEGRAWINSVPDAVSVAQGAAGGSWIDDIQAALQYAAYLDPALKEDIYDRYVWAKIKPPTPMLHPIASPAAIEQVTTGLVAWFTDVIRGAVDQVISERFGGMPQQVTETHEILRDVTVIERERTITIAGWVADGYCYLFVTKDRRRMAIGETGTSIDMRLNDGDYNGSKDGARSWEIRFAFRTNDRKAVEQLLHRCVRSMGVAPVSKRGTFVYDEQVIADFARIPTEIKLEDLQRFINEQRLFEPPMFRGMVA